MGITSNVDICNLALGHIGSFDSVSDIDLPESTTEKTFALWYDVTRQETLKMMMPNFCLSRLKVGKLAEVPVFGYSFFYEYPVGTLKIQGVGDAKDRRDDYSIEVTPNGVKAIAHDYDYTEGMPIRIIIDITDINKWSSEMQLLFSRVLAVNVCDTIANDPQKVERLRGNLPFYMSSASSVNAQENRPVRISNYKFRAARFNHYPNFENKK